MIWLVLIVVVIIVLAIISSKFKQPADQAGFPYFKKPALFSPAERSFLGVLVQAFGDRYHILGKVRVADVVEPQKGLGQSKRQNAFNRISSKHFDFILCTKPIFQLFVP